VHHANPLLKDVTTSHVRLNKRLVSHHESSHKLEDRDLNGEVEGSDNTDRSKGESVTLRHLTFMISRVRETSSKETNLITAEVFKESTSNSDFGFSLLITLRDSSLGALNHPVEDLLVMHNFNSFSADFSNHQITFLVVEGVMESIFRAFMKRVDERLNFIHASVGNFKHGFSSHGINVINVVFGANPFSLT